MYCSHNCAYLALRVRAVATKVAPRHARNPCSLLHLTSTPLSLFLRGRYTADASGPTVTQDVLDTEAAAASLTCARLRVIRPPGGVIVPAHLLTLLVWALCPGLGCVWGGGGGGGGSGSIACVACVRPCTRALVGAVAWWARRSWAWAFGGRVKGPGNRVRP